MPLLKDCIFWIAVCRDDVFGDKDVSHGGIMVLSPLTLAQWLRMHILDWCLQGFQGGRCIINFAYSDHSHCLTESSQISIAWRRNEDPYWRKSLASLSLVKYQLPGEQMTTLIEKNPCRTDNYIHHRALWHAAMTILISWPVKLKFFKTWSKWHFGWIAS
jgi:hypothetical protein